jgi:hypothetical protein
MAPYDPHALGNKHGLGNFKARYKRPLVFSPWWAFTPLAVFLLIALIPTIQSWVHDATDHRLPPFPANLFIGIGGITVLLIVVLYGLVPPGIKLLKELKTGAPVALLYDQGFVVLTTKGQEQMAAHWTDTDVWHKIEAQGGGEGGVSYMNVYTFVNRNTGESMRSPFGSQCNIAVEVAVADYQYQQYAQAAYQSGQPLYFGRLNISLQGLVDTKTNETLAWGDVESITINQAGMICIRQHGHKRDWAAIPLGAIGNMATLYRLLKADVPQTFTLQSQARIS